MEQASIKRVLKKSGAWKSEFHDLEKISLGRCIKPSKFCKAINNSLHNFSYASVIGYGQFSYLRVVDKNEKIPCSLIMEKTRVAPKKFMSILRLELGVVLSAKISNMIKKELQLQDCDEYF